MNGERFSGWFEFSQKRMGIESKIIAIIIPFTAQGILISNAFEFLFPSDILGTVGLHLAYWGALLFSIVIGIGGLLTPELVRNWDRDEEISDYVMRPKAQEIIKRLSINHKKTFLNESEKNEYFINRENAKKSHIIIYLEWSIFISQLMIVASSGVTALRVAITLME